MIQACIVIRGLENSNEHISDKMYLFLAIEIKMVFEGIREKTKKHNEEMRLETYLLHRSLVREKYVQVGYKKAHWLATNRFLCVHTSGLH